MQGRINDLAKIVACLITLKHHVQKAACRCDLAVGYVCETCFEYGLINEGLDTALKLERSLIEEFERTQCVEEPSVTGNGY